MSAKKFKPRTIYYRVGIAVNKPVSYAELKDEVEQRMIDLYDSGSVPEIESVSVTLHDAPRQAFLDQ